MEILQLGRLCGTITWDIMFTILHRFRLQILSLCLSGAFCWFFSVPCPGVGIQGEVLWEFMCLSCMFAYFTGADIWPYIGGLISFFIQLLVALKVRYPHRITILRGNHESRQVYFCNLPSLIFFF